MQRFTRPVVLSLGVLLFGCSEDAAEPEPAVHIAWITKSRCNSFFDLSRFGARLAGRDLKDQNQREVEVALLEPEDDCSASPAGDACGPAATQIARVEEAIAKKVDALAITVNSPDCVAPYLDKAVDAGIPVITFDSDAPSSKRHTYYGMDNRNAARLALRTLASLMGEKGKFAVQTAMTRDSNGVLRLNMSTAFVDRIAGIEDELPEHPDLELVATIPCISNDLSDGTCAKEVEAVLEQHPDLDGILFARGKLLRELDLAANAPNFTARIQSGTIRSVTFDASDDAMDNIQAGYAEVAIAQKQFGWGYEVVQLAFDMAVNDVEPPAFYDAGWYVVCPNNSAQYLAMWQAHDFRGELEVCDLAAAR